MTSIWNTPAITPETEKQFQLHCRIRRMRHILSDAVNWAEAQGPLPEWAEEADELLKLMGQEDKDSWGTLVSVTSGPDPSFSFKETSDDKR